MDGAAAEVLKLSENVEERKADRDQILLSKDKMVAELEKRAQEIEGLLVCKDREYSELKVKSANDVDSMEKRLLALQKELDAILNAAKTNSDNETTSQENDLIETKTLTEVTEEELSKMKLKLGAMACCPGPNTNNSQADTAPVALGSSTRPDLTTSCVNSSSVLLAMSSGLSTNIAQDQPSNNLPNTSSAVPSSSNLSSPLLVTADNIDGDIDKVSQNMVDNSNIEQTEMATNKTVENTNDKEQNAIENVVDGNRSKGDIDIVTIAGSKYNCGVCGKVFLQLGWLQKHFEKCQKEYQCDSCPVRLKNKKCLKVHQSIFHGPNSGFSCDKCDAVFSTANKLAIHVKKAHEAEKVCPHCDSKSKNKKTLRYHIKWHCKEMKKQDPNKSLTVPPEKSKDSQNKTLFQCKECDAVYKDRTGLRKHINVHKKINKLREMRLETDKNKGSANIFSEGMEVNNSNTANNVILISDDGSVIDHGQLQDIEIVYIDES